jgi:hypothetical protein
VNNVIGNVASTALNDKQQNACNKWLSIVMISNAMFLMSCNTAVFITTEMTAKTVDWNNFLWFRLIGLLF